ncbi:MAG: T9SS type A sorting domain-containing protein [Puia sp.]|nr:T9SS type A sorting domain-containing protein [Puia sp.]
MQQLYPIRKAFSLFRYNVSKILMGLLLGGSPCFSQTTANSDAVKTNGVNLPNLISFTAQPVDQKVVFNWTTSYEENLSHFTLERSTDGKSYDDRTIVFSDGNTDTRRQYVFTDNIGDLENGSGGGQVYYRLKLVGLDGQAGYSQTLVIQYKGANSGSGPIAYPNPAVSELNVLLPEGWQNRPVSYNVYNSGGRLVLQKSGNTSGQHETVNISALRIGIYLLRVATGGQAITQSFVKAN